MRLIQITDLHVGLPMELTKGIEVREQIRRLLLEVACIPCSAYIFTGDFCYKDPYSEIYAWLKTQLVMLPAPYLVIPGNHDDPQMMTQAWPEAPGGASWYYTYRWDQQICIFLDTSSGYMSEDQYHWFKDQVAMLPAPVIIFSHHPLTGCGVPYMDINHAFLSGPEVMRLLTSTGKTIHVFCGHYHVDKTIFNGTIMHHLTPSAFFQIHPESMDGSIYNYRPGYRIIDWKGDRLSTVTVYSEGVKRE